MKTVISSSLSIILVHFRIFKLKSLHIASIITSLWEPGVIQINDFSTSILLFAAVACILLSVVLFWCEKTIVQVKSIMETSLIVYWQRGIKKYLVPWASDQSKQHTAYNTVPPQFDISLWFSYLCLKWQSM